MKNIFTLLTLFCCTYCFNSSFLNAQDVPFITTWKTDNPGVSDSSSIIIPTVEGLKYSYDVDWNNDGMYEDIDLTGDAIHHYDKPGTYTIRIKGNFPAIHFNNYGKKSDSEKILSINQWGDINWKTFSGAFYGASNLSLKAEDMPDLSNVEDLSGTFYNARSFNGDIGKWDVSNVKNMEGLFFNASAFDKDLGLWDVSNVTNMGGIFWDAIAFNKDIGNWDVANVINMSGMFHGASAFNQDISRWDVAGVINMSGMFLSASAFNKDIGNWDVSNVTNMSSMFSGASNFNQDIGNWDVSKVSDMFDMYAMFSDATSFNQDIGDWNVANVTNMSSMFSGATSFNQDIGDWDVSNVTNMSSMFYIADSFNRYIERWDVSNVTDMSGMFTDAHSFDQDLGAWDVSNVTNMSRMFLNARSFNQDIGRWDVSKVTDMSFLFSGARLFNEDIGSWDVFNVTDMKYMFSSTRYFDQDIGSWDVSNVTDMSRMFYAADSFNQDIGEWDVSRVANMSNMFYIGSAFNQNIGEWDVSNVTDMSRMFYAADSFNQNIISWDVSNVNNMAEMFSRASIFNQDVGRWNVSNVIDMSGMFSEASSFNQDIGEWNISKLQNMENMLDFSGISTAVYDRILVKWDSLGYTNKILGAENLTYCMGSSARSNLIKKGWKINRDKCFCSDITKFIPAEYVFCASDSLTEFCIDSFKTSDLMWISYTQNGIDTTEGHCVKLDLEAGQGNSYTLKIKTDENCLISDTLSLYKSKPIEINLDEDSSYVITGGVLPYQQEVKYIGNNIQILVTDAIGCTEVKYIVLTSNDGLEEISPKIYPNPVHDILYLSNERFRSSYQITIVDQLGRKMGEYENVTEIDMGAFPSGLYYLQLMSSSGTFRTQNFSVVVEH